MTPAVRLAALSATLLLAACRLAGPTREPRPRGPERPAEPVAALPTEEPRIRVGLAVDTAEVTVRSDADYELDAAGDDGVLYAAAGEAWTVTADGEGRLVATAADGRRTDPVASPFRIRAADDSPVTVGGRPYRGAVLVTATGPGRLTVVNVVDLEAYLLGVVPAEIPAVDIDAVRAQAVAARTYTIRHLGHRDSLGFDVFGTVADQVYGGLAQENPVASRAVRETAGEVLTYEGRPIQAYFHSTCGGRTAAIEEVWQREPVPYLRSVSDRIPGTDDYYCETSNRFRWTERWTGDGLAAILERSLAEFLDRAVDPIAAVRGLEVAERTPSERVELLRIRANGESYDVRGDAVRRVLRPERDRMLNSTLFELDVEEEDGRVGAVAAHGGGWGHGVGMCQWGAIGRAQRGQSYRRILAAYYPGTELQRLY